MSVVAVGVIAGAGALASGYSAYASSKAAGGAADAQAAAGSALEKRLYGASGEVRDYADQYTNTLDMLDSTFDPYDMEEAFNSLYEAVIQPMERDFDQNVLPGIQAAYSGGVLGGGAMLSGAASESEANARQNLSESKAGLRFQERNNAIGRNYGEFDRRANLAGQKFSAQTAAPMLEAQVAPTVYNAQSNTIAAQLAAAQSQAAIPGQILSGAMGGATAGMSVANSLALNKYVKSKTID